MAIEHARMSHCIEQVTLGHSRNHATLEHFVGNRSRNFVDEHFAHLGIAPQHLHRFLLHGRFGLAFFLPKLLAGRILVLLDDFVGNPV